ncbi:MAG: hypothetical protein Q9165_007811 [Trypethelium subeluteriae]
MAPSPSAQQQRARIIRDLTQDRVRTRGSNSDAGSNAERENGNDVTASSFDPENEALNSTRQMDNSTQQALPSIRNTMQNNDRYRYLDDGYYIDVAAAGRLLGDQDGSSESSMSIELGRGNRRTSKHNPDQNLPSEDPTENIVFSMGDNSLWEITATPPGKPRPSAKAKNDGAKGSVMKDAPLRRTSTAVTAEHRASSAPVVGLSPGTNKSNNTRKPSTLAHMHARVTDEDDGSYMSDERPQPTATLTKSTRFGSIRNNPAPSNAILTGPGAGNELNLGASRAETPRRVHQNISTNAQAGAGTGTVQSFILPDLPNITELVSGVRADGTPVFSRTPRTRSRFASGSNRANVKGSHSVHIPIDGVPMPEEEKAIFASLHLLQDKVAQLEIEKDEKDQKLGKYENEIIELRSQAQAQKELRRSDSGLGATDDEGRGPSSWRIERAKLESSVKSLQTRLDKAEQQNSLSDISVKRITQERDDLVTQLGVAYFNVEELKRDVEPLKAQLSSFEKENDILMRENDAFRAENQALRDQLAKLLGQHEEETRDWTKKEERLRSRIQKKDDAVKEARELTRELLSARNETQELQNTQDYKNWPLPPNIRRANAKIEKDTQTKISDRIEQELRRTRSDGGNRPTTASPKKRVSYHAPFANENARGFRETRLAENQEPDAVQLIEEASDDSRSEVESTTDLDFVKQGSHAQANTKKAETQNKNHTQNSEIDITAQSLTEGDDIAKLRAALEEERKALREARAMAAQYQDEHAETTRSVGTVEKTGVQAPRRKSAMKDIVQASGANTATRSARDATNELDSGNKQSNEDDMTTRRRRPSSTTRTKHAQDNTIDSTTSKTSRRHRTSGLDDFEEMTSAFILPDITLHPKKAGTGTTTAERPTLSPEAKQVLHSLCPHDPTTCTICPHLLAHSAATAKASAATSAALASFDPVPVSQQQQRQAAAAEGDDGNDMTVRPSQPPRQALLAAIARTEDEVKHTKAGLREAERAYAASEPSRGKRRRVGLARRMEELVRRVERRSEVVYALYDVLEGLKGDGEGEGDGDGEVTEEGLIGADGARLAGKEVRGLEETLQSVGIDPGDALGEAVKEAVVGGGKKGGKVKKSVGFGVRKGAGGLPDGFYSDEDDEELPWEGIATDGESLASGRSRRNSGY